VEPVMTADLPPRVAAAEDRARFREMLDASGLGSPGAKSLIAYSRYRSAALPDRWVTLREKDLIALFEMYRDLREIEGHDDALQRVLLEVDFEPSQSDLDD
jgi:hypothetical protein